VIHHEIRQLVQLLQIIINQAEIKLPLVFIQTRIMLLELLHQLRIKLHQVLYLRLVYRLIHRQRVFRTRIRHIITPCIIRRFYRNCVITLLANADSPLVRTKPTRRFVNDIENILVIDFFEAVSAKQLHARGSHVVFKAAVDDLFSLAKVAVPVSEEVLDVFELS